jgi:hypothetical protein
LSFRKFTLLPAFGAEWHSALLARFGRLAKRFLALSPRFLVALSRAKDFPSERIANRPAFIETAKILAAPFALCICLHADSI